MRTRLSEAGAEVLVQDEQMRAPRRRRRRSRGRMGRRRLGANCDQTAAEENSGHRDGCACCGGERLKSSYSARVLQISKKSVRCRHYATSQRLAMVESGLCWGRHYATSSSLSSARRDSRLAHFQSISCCTRLKKTSPHLRLADH